VALIRHTLQRNTSRPFIVLRLPHVSAQLPLPFHLPTQRDILTSIHLIFQRHQLSAATWVGHSFGTIVVAWVRHEAPLLISKLILIDPVCFALWEHDIIFNFVYKQTQTNWLEVIIRHFVARECGVAATICRNFWWFHNILLPEEVPQGSHVFVSTRDGIIDAGKVTWYLKEHQINVTQFQGLRHAEFLVKLGMLQQVVEAMEG